MNATSTATPSEVFEFPSTPTQQSLWFVHRIDPGSAAYNIPLAFRIRGPLDEVRLLQAFEALVSRHEILRTVFRERGGELVQCVVTGMPLDWACLAVDCASAADFDGISRELAAVEAARRFGLEHGPLLRVRLFRRTSEDALLVLVLHHIVIDHLSLGQCAEELGASYDALRAGPPATADAEPALQFADYSVWLQDNASADELAPKLEAWKRRLEGFSGVLDLPADHPRPAVQHSAGAQHRLAFGTELSSRARQFARREGVSLFTVLLAALKVLMHRYSGQEDIVIGTPFANRAGQEDLERVVGCFINTLPIASRVVGTSTFRQLLASVKSTMLEAVELQDTPLGAIVDAVKPRRDPGRNPLFQVGFVLQAPPVALALQGLELEDLEVHSGGAMYDLHFWLWEGAGRIEGMAWYATELYDAPGIDRLVEHYQHVLAQVLEAPDQPLAGIGFAPPGDRRLLESWQGEARVWPAAGSIVELIEAAGRQHAGRVAIDGPQGVIRHGELHDRVDAFARRLQQRGVGPGSLVGLCMPRDVEMVIALLAILKTGAAYVPLDPDFPPQRLAYMAADARLGLIVTTQALEGAMRWPDAPAVLRVEDDDDASFGDGAAPAWPVLDPESPAYVIYTSGSSGKPKGVVVPHRSVVNFLRSMAHEPGLTEADRMLAVTTLSFDIAVLELLLPLSVGAQVVLASSAQARDGAALAGLLSSRQVTMMQATPGTWRMLLQAGWVGLSSIAALIGGEPLPPDLAGVLLGFGMPVWNMYGPTETTVWSTLWRVGPEPRGIAIGRPIANTQVHILDEALRPCPIGTPGEICIGGDGVALGYLHQPALTAERFVADPFSARPGALLYRTGDRGRWQGSGQLQHLGRLDQQVKVRGYRIEPGEIEAALVAHPQVEACVATTREAASGEASIVAYVVSRGALPAPAALREHLRTTLPDYMVAQQFIGVPAIPHLPNGKVDRGALDAFWSPPESAGAADAPARTLTVAEQAVAEVWQAILGIGQVNPIDNFFDLGGNSLQAMRAATKMEQRLGVPINLRRMIFESMGQLAATEAATADAAAQAEPQRRPGLFGRLASALRPGAKSASRG